MKKFLLILTESSKKYLQNVLEENQALNIGLKSSGCTGYSYVMKAEDIQNKEVVNFQGINFIIEDKNKALLNNSIIDYKKQGFNAKLIIENPSVKNECGCGESFSFKEV